MNDPLIQTYIVAIAIHIAATGIAFYLWTENRSERFLMFWTLAWGSGLARWTIHYPAEASALLRAVEVLLISLTMFFMVRGSFDLLPSKPWQQRSVVTVTAAILFAYGIVTITVGMPLAMGYLLFAMALAFVGVCMWRCYLRMRIVGYAFAAATVVCQLIVVAIYLLARPQEIADSIVLPLYNIPLMLSIVVIAYQRQKSKLVENERTLNKIFETAPTPIVIVHPPTGEIERANSVAFAMLGVAPDAAMGTTTLEHGLVPDTAMRQAIYAELAQGRRVEGRETTMLRAGRELRTVAINADRIALDSGDRYIYSFYDLTELRRAEDQLRASAEETRQLYMRLAHVEDDERRALHAELHDQIGANLAALRIELDVASTLLSRSEGDKAQSHLTSAGEVAAETTVMARDLMAALRPPALDDYGLVAALRTLAESQTARLNLPITVVGNELGSRPERIVENSLFRIVQEAVMNAARHASASRVTIDVKQHDGRLMLTIEDDGVGFDPQAPMVEPDHWGLRNMRERAHAIGGTLEVITAPGRGTRVVAEVPRTTS
jgi:PAS domain S-box-containing protein